MYKHANIQRMETGLRVDPRVVLSSHLLQLNQGELEQAIETELNENPALERLDDEFEPIDEAEILKAIAPQELRRTADDYECLRSLPADEAPDWLDFATSTPSLHDHLRAQIGIGLPAEFARIAEYLVDCVDDRGYLSAPLEEIALLFGCSLDDAEEVLRRLQACEPAGVGARDIVECLLLQLRGAQTIEQKLARAIVRSHMDELMARRTTKLMRRYKVLPEVVEAAFDEILSLNPYPGEGFSPSAGLPSASRSQGVVPDLVLHHREEGWLIEVRGAEPTSFTVNRSYQSRMDELGRKERAYRDEKRHVTTFVNRAKDFIQCLAQRRQTLRKIGEYLIEHQSGFVSTGRYEFLQPLTRTQVAHDCGLHESTVSRATMDKFVQLANGEIVPFEVFFKPALRIQRMIEEILQTENPDFPLSDERIAEMLRERGVVVARRTVNKYRDRTKLPSSRKRRSA
jgi:RNA polymerase sigma-54 factor